MYTEDIHKYLKDLSNYLNKQKNIHLNINASIEVQMDSHVLLVRLNDKADSLQIQIAIPTDRTKPATIKIHDDENKNIHANIGNSRNVPLEHDINFISQVITEAAKQNNAVEYTEHKLIEVFTKAETPLEKLNTSNKKRNEIKISLNKDKIDDIISRANFKGANIISWHKTPNNKVVLRYKYKDNESYGSEFETNVHLYYAYLLKNKYPSTRVF